MLVSTLFFGTIYAQDSKTTDYNSVDSYEKAFKLYQNKELEKDYFMALEFGGEDVEINTFFVPFEAKIKKKEIDNKLSEALEKGKNLHLTVEPVYKGKSFIPSKLIIIVSGDEKYTKTIDVW